MLRTSAREDSWSIRLDEIFCHYEVPQCQFLLQTWTFIESFWWGLMTLTTVGYEVNPGTLFGKIIGGMCALSGIFILTLPIPIVVNR